MPEFTGRPELHFIPFESLSIAANGSVSITQSLGPEADFVVSKITKSSTGVFKFKIKDAGRGTYLTKDYVHVNTVAADLSSSGAMDLPREYRFLSNGAIIIEITDLSGSTNSIYMTFTGYLVYRGQA